MEDRFPGLWHTWFREQVAAVGWNAQWGFTLEGAGEDRSWAVARGCLKRVKPGDKIVVQLQGSRIGRVGEIVRLRVADNEWEPTVPKSKEQPDGEQGRRILVRWYLGVGPSNPDQVVELPSDARLSGGQVRRTICELDQGTFERINQEMQDESNWVSICPAFAYERSLSDFVGAFPHRLGDGLRPFPSQRPRTSAQPIHEPELLQAMRRPDLGADRA